MFWHFLTATGLSIGLIQLGAQSVWVTVLTLALKALLALILATALLAGGFFAWKRFMAH